MFRHFPPFSSASPILISLLFAFPPGFHDVNHKTKHTHFRHTLSCEELPPGYRRHNIPPGAPVNLSSSRDTERAVFVPTQRRSNTSRRRRAPQHGRLVRVTTLFVGNCQLFFCWRGGALKDFEEKVPWSFYFFGGGMNLQYNYLIHISYIYIYIYHHCKR